MGQFRDSVKSTFKLKPEDELIIYCARTKVDEDIESKIEFLVTKNLDWEYILHSADLHGLKQLLYWHLNNLCFNDVPVKIMGELKQFFNENARNNLLLWGELLILIELLEENGIEAVPYKGPILSFSAYKNLTLRCFVDIDLIVDPMDVPFVRKLIQSIGYQPELNINESMELKFIKYQNEYKFFNNKKETFLDIHWKFTNIFLPNSRKLNFLDKNLLESIEISKKTMKTLFPEHMFLIMCIHNYSHHWSELSLLVDLAEYIKSQDHLSWLKIEEMAKQSKIEKIVLINLNLLKEIFGFNPVNDGVFSTLNANEVVEMSNEIRNQIFDEGNEVETKLLRQFVNNIKYRDTLFMGVMDCVKDAFIPTNFELEKIRLPSVLFPLYHLIRPFLLIIRYRL